MMLISACRILSYGVHKLFNHIFTKWPPSAILVFRFSPKTFLVINGCVKYELGMSIGLRETQASANDNWCICLRANTGYIPKWRQYDDFLDVHVHPFGPGGYEIAQADDF